MDEQEEIWKVIPEFPDYAVSSHGNVKRITACHGTRPGKIAKPRTLRGYSTVRVRKDNKYHSRGVHSLVAMAFIGPRPHGMVVNHKDTNKANNHFSNLEYCTQYENVHHAISNGLDSKGEKHGFAKLTWNDVNEARKRRGSGESVVSIYNDMKPPMTYNGFFHAVSGRNWRTR